MAQLPQNADAVIARMKQSPHSSVDGSGGSPDDKDEGRQFKVPHPPLSPENRASTTQVSEISLQIDKKTKILPIMINIIKIYLINSHISYRNYSAIINPRMSLFIRSKKLLTLTSITHDIIDLVRRKSFSFHYIMQDLAKKLFVQLT